MTRDESAASEAAILLVEDDPDDVRLIEMALRDASIPIRITTVSDGAEALAHLEGCDDALPDLVLLDLNLPVMSGAEFLSRLRAHGAYSALPVCVFTTADDPVTIRRAYAAGANAVVTKADSLAGMSEVLGTIVEFWFKVAERYRLD
jgi:CheY-like chemotaxis protein